MVNSAAYNGRLACNASEKDRKMLSGKCFRATLGDWVAQELWFYRIGFKFWKEDSYGQLEFRVMFLRHEVYYLLLIVHWILALAVLNLWEVYFQQTYCLTVFISSGEQGNPCFSRKLLFNCLLPSPGTGALSFWEVYMKYLHFSYLFLVDIENSHFMVLVLTA